MSTSATNVSKQSALSRKYQLLEQYDILQPLQRASNDTATVKTLTPLECCQIISKYKFPHTSYLLSILTHISLLPMLFTASFFLLMQWNA